MSRALPDLDAELFKKQFPELTEKQLQKLEDRVLQLYESSIEIVQRLVERGFTDNHKDINAKEWILFATKMIPIIEQVRGVVGREKLELLLAFAIFIIIKSLPIDPISKELLIVIVREFLPDIIDGIIFASKKVHTFGSWLRKKCKCMS